MGLSQPPFGFIFPFSWYIVRLQLINFTTVNDDRKQERRRKSMHRSITRYLKKFNTYIKYDGSLFQVVSEPAAACLAYNLGQLDPLESFKCLVYRCGGHSLTVSVVLVQSGMFQIIK